MLSPNFIFYSIAQVLITLASSMLSVAVGWHIYQATGNPFDLALVGLMQILPIVGLFMPAGWVVDNFPRNRILVACTVLQGVTYIGLAFSLAGDGIDRTATFALLFLNGVARVFFSPAMQSTLPKIVSAENLTRAVAVSSTAWTTSGAPSPSTVELRLARRDRSLRACSLPGSTPASTGRSACWP